MESGASQMKEHGLTHEFSRFNAAVSRSHFDNASVLPNLYLRYVVLYLLLVRFTVALGYLFFLFF